MPQTTSSSLRLRQDYLRIKEDPVPYILAEPLPANILEWHYVVWGPENSPYEGGYYHGKLVFPKEFPFKPPSIFMITPNGRFKTNIRLCLSISDYHPDTWNPAWSVSTILTGLLSFMLEKSPTLGSIETTDYEKRQYAFYSLQCNLNDGLFKELFPDIVIKILEELDNRKKSNQTTFAAAEAAHMAQRKTADPSSLQSCILNFLLIVGFVAFAYSVKYVMLTSTSD